MQRLGDLFRAKTYKLVERMEDPRKTLDYSSERLRELLQQVRRGVADVAPGEKRLELQAAKVAQRVGTLDEQARQALSSGREDLARAALERKKLLESQLQSLDAQRGQLQSEQDKLVLAEQRLAAKLAAFRSHKEAIEARYTAAEAQVRIGEAFSGVSEEMADVGLAIDRAESRTKEMQAQAMVLERGELVPPGEFMTSEAVLPTPGATLEEARRMLTDEGLVPDAGPRPAPNAAGPAEGEIVFIWSKRSGERPRVRFLWWPLLVGLAISVLLTVMLNFAR